MPATPKLRRSLYSVLSTRKMQTEVPPAPAIRPVQPHSPGAKPYSLIPDEPTVVTPLFTETPETPGPLQEAGLTLWYKICKILYKRGTLCEDFLQPLYTLCSLHDLATDLHSEYIDCLTTNGMGGTTKINPAIIEWTKAVALLRTYYADFELTPVAARKSSARPNDTKCAKASVVNRRKVPGIGAVGLDDLFEPL